MPHRKTYVAFAFAFFLSMYFRTFFAVVGPELSRDLALTPVQFGLLSSAFFASFAISQVPVGLLFDRFGCRLPAAVLVLLGSVGAALMAGATSFFPAVLGHGLLGIGCAPALMSVYFCFGQTQTWQKAARTATGIAALGSIGALVSTTPLEMVVSSFGWRNAVAVSACFLAVAAGLVWMWVPALTRSQDIGRDASDSIKTNPMFLALLAPIFLSASLGTVFRSAWASPYLLDVVELSSQGAANIFALISVAGTVTGFLLPFAMRRWKPGSIVAVFYTCAITLTAALAIGPAQSPISAAAALSMLYAIGNCHTIAMAEAQSHIEARRRGVILGLLNGLGFVGVALFSPLFGVIARVFDQEPAFSIMFGVTACALVVSLIAYLFRGRAVRS